MLAHPRSSRTIRTPSQLLATVPVPTAHSSAACASGHWPCSRSAGCTGARPGPAPPPPAAPCSRARGPFVDCACVLGIRPAHSQSPCVSSPACARSPACLAGWLGVHQPCRRAGHSPDAVAVGACVLSPACLSARFPRPGSPLARPPGSQLARPPGSPFVGRVCMQGIGPACSRSPYTPCSRLVLHVTRLPFASVSTVRPPAISARRVWALRARRRRVCCAAPLTRPPPLR